MPPYRLFATDLDGTVFGHDLVISPRNRQAFETLHARGVHVAVVTGRMFRATVPIAHALAIKTPLVTYQGALIRELDGKTDLYHRTLAPDLAREALDALEATGLHINLYVDDELYLKRLTPEAESYTALAKVTARQVPHWDAALGTLGPTKIVAIGREEEIVRQVAAFKERFGDRLFVTQSLPTFLEIAHPEVSKGAALATLAGTLGVQPHEVVAVGDGLNDLEMIRFAGLGVAMGNGNAKLKAEAARVTGRYDEDGVARLIDDLIHEGAL